MIELLKGAPHLTLAAMILAGLLGAAIAYFCNEQKAAKLDAEIADEIAELAKQAHELQEFKAGRR